MRNTIEAQASPPTKKGQRFRVAPISRNKPPEQSEWLVLFLEILTLLNGEKAAATAVRPVEGSESSTLEECLLEHAGDHE